MASSGDSLVGNIHVGYAEFLCLAPCSLAIPDVLEAACLIERERGGVMVSYAQAASSCRMRQNLPHDNKTKKAGGLVLLKHPGAGCRVQFI